MHIYIYIYILQWVVTCVSYCTIREFKDVVFEDVVFDNNSLGDPMIYCYYCNIYVKYIISKHHILKHHILGTPEQCCIIAYRTGMLHRTVSRIMLARREYATSMFEEVELQWHAQNADATDATQGGL